MQPLFDPHVPAAGHGPAAVSPAPGSVLIVDDEAGVRALMARWLQSAGYEVLTASSADEAMLLMERAPAGVVVCDICLAGHDGLWLASRLRHEFPDTAVIMATGLQEVGPAVESLRQGVVDYLTKPFGRVRLRESVARALVWHDAERQARQWCDSLRQEMHARHARLVEVVSDLQVNSDETVDVLLATVTMGNRDAYAHAYRVAAVSVGVARALDMTEGDVAVVERGALLHDVGKLAMPEALLRKTTPLTAGEQALLRLHPSLGSELIRRFPYLAEASTVVRDAHERVDGLGFPRGTRGNAVWIGARIVSVADAYDTMTRPRVFRDALGAAEALAELERCSGTQFDARLVDVVRRVVVPS